MRGGKLERFLECEKVRHHSPGLLRTSSPWQLERSLHHYSAVTAQDIHAAGHLLEAVLVPGHGTAAAAAVHAAHHHLTAHLAVDQVDRPRHFLGS